MASFCTSLTLFLVFIACHFSVALPYRKVIKISTISGPPALLPEAPQSYSPSQSSPDILFPTPGGEAAPPSESLLPTIPASPSPPNPDAITSPEPGAMAFPPAWSMTVSTSVSHKILPPVNSVGKLAMLTLFLMWISAV